MNKLLEDSKHHLLQIHSAPFLLIYLQFLLIRFPPSFTFVRTQGTQNDGLRTMMIQDSDKTQIESADKSHSSSTMDLKDSTTPDTDATDSIPLFYSFIAPPSTVNTHTGWSCTFL